MPTFKPRQEQTFEAVQFLGISETGLFLFTETPDWIMAARQRPAGQRNSIYCPVNRSTKIPCLKDGNGEIIALDPQDWIVLLPGNFLAASSHSDFTAYYEIAGDFAEPESAPTPTPTSTKKAAK